MDPSSTTFIKRPPCLTNEQETFLYTKEILSGRIFLGCYEERRYVSVLNEYRDLVIISPEETELHHDLDKVRKKLFGIVGIKWVGITGPEIVGMPKAYCFWVKFTNLPFGHYWFQIRHVKLAEGEILLHLKQIRKSFTPAYTTTATQKSVALISQKESAVNKNEEAVTSTSVHSPSNEENWDFDLKSTFLYMYGYGSAVVHLIWPHINRKNFLTFIRVTCAVIIAAVMGSISFVGHLGEYFLKLLRELSILVNSFTPIAIHIIDFFSKIIGAIFILIARLCFNNGPVRPPPNYRQKLYVLPPSGGHRIQNPSLDWRERNRMLREELLSNQKKF